MDKSRLRLKIRDPPPWVVWGDCRPHGCPLNPYAYNTGIITANCSDLCPGRKAWTKARLTLQPPQVGADPLLCGRVRCQGLGSHSPLGTDKSFGSLLGVTLPTLKGQVTNLPPSLVNRYAKSGFSAPKEFTYTCDLGS